MGRTRATLSQGPPWGDRTFQASVRPVFWGQRMTLWERTQETGRWGAVNGSPAYQFPFQLLGGFLGGTLTVQHQGLPDPGCDVLTAYHCPWETAPRWRGRKRDGACTTSTGWVRELREQCPGSRKVLGRLGRGGELSAGRRGVGSGSPHRLRTSTQAPTAAPAAILLLSQAPGSVCPSRLWPRPRCGLYPFPCPHLPILSWHREC